MPFGEYSDFDDCIAKNGNKSDPKAYCAAIKKQIEGESAKRKKNEAYARKHGFKTDEKGRVVIAENVPVSFQGEIVHE